LISRSLVVDLPALVYPCDEESFKHRKRESPSVTTPGIRPSFEIEIDRDPDELMELLRRRLPRCPRCTGMSVGRHAELFVPESECRVWSPWLSVTASENAGGTLVRGRFAPHPSVWTFYLFLAFGLGFTLLVGLTWGYAQWATEARPWALATVPVALVLAVCLYGVSLIGQKMSASQMADLRDALDELVYSR